MAKVGIGTLMKFGKMAMGQLDEDMLGELAESLGWKFEFGDLEKEQFPVAFQKLQENGSLPSTEIMRLKITTREGDEFAGLLVLNRANTTKVTAA